MPIRLRHFIYLDEALVQTALSQIHGATFGKGSLRSTADRGHGFGGSLGSESIVSLKADRSRSSSEEREVEFEPSPEAAFNELHAALDASEGGIVPLSNLDAQIWGQLARGDTVEVEGIGSLPLLTKVARVGRMADDLSHVLEPMAELMQLVGHEEAGTAAAMVDQIGQYGKASAVESENDPTLNLVVAVRDAPKYRFACPLKRKYLRVDDVLELEREYTVFGTIQRKLGKGERHPLGRIPDFERLSGNRAARRRAAKRATDSPPEGLFLESPGIVLTPLAVYL